jgi:hypothetical protein
MSTKLLVSTICNVQISTGLLIDIMYKAATARKVSSCSGSTDALDQRKHVKVKGYGEGHEAAGAFKSKKVISKLEKLSL